MSINNNVLAVCYLIMALMPVSCADPQTEENASSLVPVATTSSKDARVKNINKGQTPIKTVEKFYQYISENKCDKALLIRPEYKITSCHAITESNINSIREEFNNGKKAVIYLNLSFVKKSGAKDFTGFILLIKNGNSWLIQEDYASIDNTTYEEFLARHGASGAAQQQTITPSEELIAMSSSDDQLEKSNHPKILKQLRKQYPDESHIKIILVDISDQQLYVYNNKNKLLKKYPVSTATKGYGNKAGSDKTPLGAHIISDRIGDNAAFGSIFVGRVDTGKIAKIIKKAVDVPSDDVTSRILWLDGLEAGKNKGGNVDSHSRYIYIHGTPEEGLIGQPASHGCIRMKNKDVIKLFSNTAQNTLVYIGK